MRPDEQKQWYVSGTATLEEPTLSETDVCCERQEKQGFSFPLITVKKVVLNSNKNLKSFKILPALADLWVNEQGGQEGHDAVS